MREVELKKTYSYDFEKIYPLLEEFDSPYSREDWRRIFSYDWAGVEDYVGFHLEQDGCVVGFMGLIFSYRYKNGNRYTFCNITSLIVKEGYRAATVLLIRKLKSLENIIFTGLSPIDESYRILKMIGFSDYERRYMIIPTINHFIGRRGEAGVYGVPALLDRVDVENRRIVTDHADLKCSSMLFDFNGNHCLLVYKILKQSHFGIFVKKVRIIYISDISLFNEKMKVILSSFYEFFGFFSAIYVDSRFVRNKGIFLSFMRDVNPPRICLSQYGNQIDIDELYSEAVLLS